MLRKNELRSVINETILEVLGNLIDTMDREELVEKLEINIKRMWYKEDV